MKDLDVSRETLEGLRQFEALLLKWSPKINLVSRSTLPEIWQRHILDSLQLIPLLPSASHVVDLGSGGGLPAIPVAIARRGIEGAGKVTLLESDRRKSEFLRTVIRKLGLNADVISERIEVVEPQSADVVTARALATCEKLFGLAKRHLDESGKCLFLKGETVEEELESARTNWHFSLVSHPSTTNLRARIIEVQELRRA